VLIAARRPDSPRLVQRKGKGRPVAASASPSPRATPESSPAETPSKPDASAAPQVTRRVARIVRASEDSLDDRERERRRLLERLLTADGRGAVSRAANAYLDGGFALPDEQAVHLQLLEHFDEGRVRDALSAMTRLLGEQPPIKRPVLDQRLRRIEEHADEAPTRSLAAELRRTIRA
jgi:hypothetical protein